MRAILQRVTRASVSVDQKIIGEIGSGWLVFLGICSEDEEPDVNYLTDKVINLRSFCDEAGKLNLSIQDICGEILVVSQFTLFGDCRKGRRPSFSAAANPDMANVLYQSFVAKLKASCPLKIETGKFQAMMAVELINDGPITLMLDSKKSF